MRFKALMAVFCAATLMVSLPAGVAFGAGTQTCLLDNTTRWRGLESGSGSTNRHGAYAQASDLTMQLCVEPPNTSASKSFYFSNVEPSNGHGLDIVQTGFGRCRGSNCGGGGMKYFVAWARSHLTPGCEGQTDVYPVVNDRGNYVAFPHSYKVWHSNNLWRFYIDTNEVYDLGESYICWTPRRATWFTETQDYGDQMGGVSGAKFSVSELKYTTTEGGNFTYANFDPAGQCTYGGTGYPFFCDITQATTFNVWTNR